MAAASLSPSGREKKLWWLTNRKMVERYVREAKVLIATGEIAAALGLLEAALSMAPRMEVALEIKARCLLLLRRFKEVADMLQDYMPSLKMPISDETSSPGSSEGSSTQLLKERVMFLSSAGDSLDEAESAFRCFSVTDLRKKVMGGPGLCKNEEKGQWRYSVLGQACCHLGLMEESIVLLQTGKRLAAAAFRRESITRPDDIFSFNRFPLSGNPSHPQNLPQTESNSITHLLCHIKLLIRRKTAAVAALDAGLHSEAIRHFSKILDGRNGAPQGFLSECYILRASAYRSTGRIAESIADCNKALALNTSSIDALTTRASLFETINCLPDSLHDLEHLKLLYNSILRDRKLLGPIWKRQSVQYREIPGRLCSLASKIQQLKQKLAAGEIGNVDYYALIGLQRGCSRSELERAHLLLMLKHKPDKSSSFTERCEFVDEKEMDSVKDRARVSALMLYRLIQKGYTSLMATIMDEEAAEKERKKGMAKAALPLAVAGVVENPVEDGSDNSNNNAKSNNMNSNDKKVPITTPPASVFQGVFCRDLAVVSNLLSQAGFNRPIPVKYEALSC